MAPYSFFICSVIAATLETAGHYNNALFITVPLNPPADRPTDRHDYAAKLLRLHVAAKTIDRIFHRFNRKVDLFFGGKAAEGKAQGTVC